MGILEMDTIIQAEIKEKKQKSISDEEETFSKPTSATGIPSKGCPPCKILMTFLEMDKFVCCLMAYQLSWVIQYHIHPSRRTVVVLFNP